MTSCDDRDFDFDKSRETGMLSICIGILLLVKAAENTQFRHPGEGGCVAMALRVTRQHEKGIEKSKAPIFVIPAKEALSRWLLWEPGNMKKVLKK